MPSFNLEKQKINTIAITGDGDCMFGALVHQLYGISPKMEQQEKCIMMLRNLVSSHIQENIQEFEEQIRSNITDMNDTIFKEGMERGEIIKYCNQLKNRGFWGGAETLWAVAKIFEAKIEIYIEGKEEIINIEGTQGKIGKIIKLAYRRGGGNENDHYESITTIEREADEGGHTRESKNPQKEADCHLSLEVIDHSQSSGYIVRRKEREIKHQQQKQCLKIATWNIRGCAKSEKRDIIDETLEELDIDLAGLQETHNSLGKAETSNYKWWTAGNKGEKEYRGVAILIKKTSNIQITHFKAESDSVCWAIVEWKGVKIAFIIAHVGCSTDTRRHKHLAEINGILANIHSKHHIVILGDLNAHFGKNDMTEEERRRIGPRLRYTVSNENGIYIKNLMERHNLTLHNSWSQSNTVLTTWSNGTAEAQLDHIISSRKKESIKNIKARWLKIVETDHKIVFGLMDGDLTDQTKIANTKINKKKSWQISTFKNPQKSEDYKYEIMIALEDLDLQIKHPNTGIERWTGIKDILTEAATNTLAEVAAPITPNRRKALAQQKKARYLRHKFPQEEEYRINLAIANNNRKEAVRVHFIKECSKIMKGLRNMHPNQRLHELMKLIKNEKKNHTNKTKSIHIPMKRWEEILRQEEGTQVEYIREEDNIELPPPPRAAQIREWIKRGKSGRAPGVDGIDLDLLAHTPPRLIKELADIFARVWEDNNLPQDWTMSIQVPIPKIKAPKNTNNYRRISLCSIMYKLYAKHILYCLDNILPETPAYQAAFLPERATDDHIFVVNRILEERWRGGQKTLIMALDIEKAFDTVKHTALIATLKHYKVPHKLINRIIKACMNEETMIQWYGQRSTKVKKGMGVKQGCPLSPRLFNLMMDEVLQSVAEVLTYIDLNQNEKITLPMILVFADDMLIISDSEVQIKEIINELQPMFESIGLKINMEKSKLLVRDPKALIKQTGEIIIGNMSFCTVENLEYLGITLTDTLDRKANLRKRVKKAYVAAHSLLPFLQRHHLRWHITKNLYELAIVPIVTYGMKNMVLTKANRNSLRGMERDIVRLLVKTCRPTEKASRANELLKNKMIVRKIAMLRIRHWGHIIRRTEGHLLQRALSYSTKKRKIGRPCHIWKNSLIRVKEKYDIQEVNWQGILLDKKKTKETSKKIFELPDPSDSEDSV